MSKSSRQGTDGLTAAADPDSLPGWPQPRETPRLFGHAGAYARFAETAASGRLHHAWLVCGPPGIGKATFAYALARGILGGDFPAAAGGAVHFEADTPLFRQIASLAHPGLFALRRALQSGGKAAQVIPVEEIRRLKHFFETTAASPWRVVIIDEANHLNASAANALLKLLEEPPPRSLFLLLSSAPARLPATIRSRCLRLALQPLAAGELRRTVDCLCADMQREPPAAADFESLAWLAQGSPRRVLEMLDAKTAELFALTIRIINALPRLDHEAVLELIDKAAGQPERTASVLDMMERCLQDVCWQASGKTSHTAARIGLNVSSGLAHPSNLALLAGVWERMNRSRAEAERLNLDRSAVLLTVFADLQSASSRAHRDHSRT